MEPAMLYGNDIEGAKVRIILIQSALFLHHLLDIRLWAGTHSVFADDLAVRTYQEALRDKLNAINSGALALPATQVAHMVRPVEPVLFDGSHPGFLILV